MKDHGSYFLGSIGNGDIHVSFVCEEFDCLSSSELNEDSLKTRCAKHIVKQSLPATNIPLELKELLEDRCSINTLMHSINGQHIQGYWPWYIRDKLYSINKHFRYCDNTNYMNHRNKENMLLNIKNIPFTENKARVTCFFLCRNTMFFIRFIEGAEYPEVGSMCKRCTYENGELDYNIDAIYKDPFGYVWYIRSLKEI